MAKNREPLVPTADIDRWLQRRKRAEVLRREARIIRPDKDPALRRLQAHIASSTIRNASIEESPRHGSKRRKK